MRVLLVSNIHGNYDALRAVLESALRHDEVWVLGDLVDYGPEPEVVVDAIRELPVERASRAPVDNHCLRRANC